MKTIIEQIWTEIKQAKTIICLHHRDPDGDAIGSSFGLAHFLRANFPQKTILVDGSKDPEYLAFLGKHDVVDPQLYKEALVVVTDTANVARIDSEHFQDAHRVIKIDHHPDVEPYGDVQWVDSSRIAACELVGELVLNSGLPVPKASLECLFTGIITDSNRFLYQNTSAGTLQLVSKMIECGLDMFAIYNALYTQNLDSFRLKAFIMHRMKISATGVGYVTLKALQVKKFNKTLDDARGLVNVLSGIDEVKIWLIATPNPQDGNIKVSIRSRNFVVNQTAQKYNGGGHALAAGAKLQSMRQLKRLIQDLEEVIINNKIWIREESR